MGVGPGGIVLRTGGLITTVNLINDVWHYLLQMSRATNL